MIEINGHKVEGKEQLAIFPDKTSQVWHLPERVIKANTCQVTWWFEEEREVIDLLSIRKLTRTSKWLLKIPYFPYARQDKLVSNDATFNREVIIDLLDLLDCKLITAVDIHSPINTDPQHFGIRGYSSKFVNLEVSDFHAYVIEDFKPDFLVFPDEGAHKRYPHLDGFECLIFEFEKARDQATGFLTSHQLIENVRMPGGKYLIIDDLCDGGATFVSIASQIREKVSRGTPIGLAVTHGLFSRGKDYLYIENNIELYYTNSLLKNEDGFRV